MECSETFVDSTMFNNKKEKKLKIQAITRCDETICHIEVRIVSNRRGPKGFRARIRDKIINGKIYEKRSIREGFFGALTNWFGDKTLHFLDNNTITRIGLRIVAYGLWVLLRFYINPLT